MTRQTQARCTMQYCNVKFRLPTIQLTITILLLHASMWFIELICNTMHAQIPRECPREVKDRKRRPERGVNGSLKFSLENIWPLS